MRRWSLKAVASASGRAVNTCNVMALAGLVPGYQGQGIPPDVAEPFIVLLRNGAYTTRLARQMRENPHAVLDTAEALARLARTQLQLSHQEGADKQEAA